MLLRMPSNYKNILSVPEQILSLNTFKEDKIKNSNYFSNN